MFLYANRKMEVVRCKYDRKGWMIDRRGIKTKSMMKFLCSRRGKKNAPKNIWDVDDEMNGSMPSEGWNERWWGWAQRWSLFPYFVLMNINEFFYNTVGPCSSLQKTIRGGMKIKKGWNTFSLREETDVSRMSQRRRAANTFFCDTRGCQAKKGQDDLQRCEQVCQKN